MTCDREERAEICGEMSRSLSLVRATLTAAESAILRGDPDTAILLRLVSAASSVLAELEPARDVLAYSVTHGPRPYSEGELARSVPYDQETIARIIDQLGAEGILDPRGHA